jgi:hypothetical protein
MSLEECADFATFLNLLVGHPSSPEFLVESNARVRQG